MAPDDQRPDRPGQWSAAGSGAPDQPDPIVPAQGQQDPWQQNLPQPRRSDAVGPQEQPQPPVDPQAWQRFQEFQEFQQFQEFQRQQGRAGGAPLPPPVPQQAVGPGTRPLWQRVVRGKLFRRLVLLLLVVLALNWAYDHYFGGPDEDLPASQTGGGTTKTNLVLETTPEQAVRKVYDNIAQDIAKDACTRFDDTARTQFVDHFGGGTCENVIAGLHARVTDANDYAESIPAVLPGVRRGQPQTEVSSCAAGISGGPALGVFTVEQIELGQWLIVGHRLESDPCPPPTTAPRTPSTRPTS